MYVKKIHVKNFRSIENETVELSKYTSVIGRNGSGKSTLLRALTYFYDLSISVNKLDYFAGDETREIEIALTFSDLTREERDTFGSNIQGDELRVVKIFNENARQGVYHSFALQKQEFVAVRQITSKSGQLTEYRRIQQGFEGLPAVRSADEALAALLAYEAEHPDECEMAPMPGQFLGPRNVGGGSLDNVTKFIFVPATHNAEEEVEGKSGALNQLISAIASTYQERQDVREIGEEYKRRMAAVFENVDGDELSKIAGGINQVLEEYAESSRLNIKWSEPEEPGLKLPAVIRELVEDEFHADIKRVGHGLQRTLVVAILQYLALREVENPEQLKIVLAFEEPELYQHPSKCKFIGKLLKTLTDSGSFQVLLVTHSPYFVDINSFDEIVYARKAQSETVEGVRKTTFSRVDIERSLDRLSTSMDKDRRQVTKQSLEAFSKPIFNTSVSEGYFSERVVLVEGATEVGLLSAIEEIEELDWERRGISVVACEGKTKLDKPKIIFDALGIRTSVIFDWDSGEQSDAQYNRGLQRLSLGVQEVPNDLQESTIRGDALLFFRKAEDYLRDECGEQFDALVGRAAQETGNGVLSNEKALKRTEVVNRLIHIARSDHGVEFELLRQFARHVSR